MQIVFFAHPRFTNSVSMNKYAIMLAEGMQKRGHNVQTWYPKSYFSSLIKHEVLVKWAGYIDQFVIFPLIVRFLMSKCAKDTLFVIIDQALGPWVSLIKHKPHVVHCHDFLAQESALDQIEENKVSFTGKIYQKFIHTGYIQARNFISISCKTQKDLHRFLGFTPTISEVVYNWVDPIFEKKGLIESLKVTSEKLKINLKNGYILHVGGNQFYKNRIGVIEGYNAWREKTELEIPLLMIGKKPSEELDIKAKESVYKSDIFFLTEVKDHELAYYYSGASVLFFPSTAEGFGWPIVEAMKCGCLVITTNEVPMSEVGGNAALLIPSKKVCKNWGTTAACAIEKIINVTSDQRKELQQKGYDNIERFQYDHTFSRLEEIYTKILNEHYKNT